MSLYIGIICFYSSFQVSIALTRSRYFQPFESQISQKECKHVCDDLSPFDEEPVCMMYSRYKKGYQFFVNLCHARRAICRENLLLHLVHSNRCQKTNQFFMPIS